MSTLKKIAKLIVNSNYRQMLLMEHGFYNRLSDEAYLKKKYRLVFGKEPDLDSPRTFNEKLQWLKLYDRDPVYKILVDKYAVKGYIAEHFGDEYVIPTIGAWDNADDIDFDSLPERFVLKCNHNSGKGVIVCRGKEGLDIKKTRKELREALRQDFYMKVREWPYKDVPRKIICEEFLHDAVSSDGNDELRDYKFFCFNGKVRVFKIDFDRFIVHRANYYNREGELLPFGEAIYPPDQNAKLTIPDELDEMIALSEKIAGDHPFVRVDLYNVNGKIYFSEFTLYPFSGMGKFIPEDWDEKLGEWLVLPEYKRPSA